MYRGSTFLLWKDYRVHCPAIKGLLRARYDALANLSLAGSSTATIDLLLELVDAIRLAYVGNITIVNGRSRRVAVTDALASKVALGTLACLPA